jgi:hypothetical protein
MPKAQERFRIDSNLGYEKRGMATRETPREEFSRRVMRCVKWDG